MSNLQIIEALCNLVEQQARLINHLAIALDEAACLSGEERRMVKETNDVYSAILGADEVPGNLWIE